jgi:hypothetical protein
MSRRVESLEGKWADKLGVDTAEDLSGDLAARFAHLLDFVLTGEMPRPGSVEASIVYADVWTLSGFLVDARQSINRHEMSR